MDNDLIAFATARLDEDYFEAYKFHHDSRWGADMLASLFDRDESDPIIHHIARYDPDRALREVEAKRAILAEHEHLAASREPLDPEAGKFGCKTCHYDDAYGEIPPLGWCRTVRLLGTVWRDHPDYREEWKL